MPSIQFSGVSSNLDTAGIIDALMQSAQAPLTRLKTRETDLTARRNAILDVRTKFTDLLSKLRVFTESKAGAGMSATSGNATAFTASATSAAISAAYSVKVDHLATSTVSRSTAAIGTAITNGAQNLAALPLRGSVSAGTIGMVVDGTVVQVTVGDPTSTTLDDLGNAIATAMSDQVDATDPGAAFTYSIVDNRIEFALAGGTTSHTVSFGVAGDSSNALGILGLSTAGATVSAGSSISGTTLLGVAQANQTLGTSFAGLAGQTGTLTVNGVDFAWNAATDTLGGILSRINASSAGVVASIDRTSDRIVFTSKTAGAAALDIRDTAGALGAALNLAPGTTAAQVLGTNAQVTVNGTTYTSATNQVTNAIDGVTINLLAETTTTASLTVAADRTGITTALKDLVASYNAAADSIDSYSANQPGVKTKGVLATDTTVKDVLAQVRQLIFTSTGAAGPYNNLAAIGINSGAIGSAAGSTSRLSLDTTKLNAALDANPSAVANLLSSATGAINPLVDRVNLYAGPVGVFYKQTQSMATELSRLSAQESDLQERIDHRRAALEAKYAAMEGLLSKLQSTSSQLSSQTAAANKNTNG